MRIRPLYGSFVPLRDIAERMSISYQTAVKWARAGRIPAATMWEGMWRIPADKAEAWVMGWWKPAEQTWREFAEANGVDPGVDP